METIKSRHFRCDCNMPQHSLFIEVIGLTDGSDWPFLSISIVNYPTSLWGRIKGAIAILRNKDHYMSEIVMHRDDIEEFVDYIVSLVHNPNTS